MPNVYEHFDSFDFNVFKTEYKFRTNYISVIIHIDRCFEHSEFEYLGINLMGFIKKPFIFMANPSNSFHVK